MCSWTPSRKRHSVWERCDGKQRYVLVYLRYEVDGNTGEVRCDFTCARLIVHVLPDQAAKSPSHMETWPHLADHDKGKPWNYYLRGRVEIRGVRAFVFLNPLVLECAETERMLREVFEIAEEKPIVFKADNSYHYHCAGNGVKISSL